MMTEKTAELQKLIEKLENMREDSENWSEDQFRSFEAELLPELEGTLDEMEEDLIGRIQKSAERKGCDSILKNKKRL